MKMTANNTSVNLTTPFRMTEPPPPLSSSPDRIALIGIYMVVLMVGTLGIVLMINVLKCNLRSVTTVAVLNLIVAHLIFMPTIPFRIDYYIRNRWDLPPQMCKIVSSMVHIHMYLSFLIYVIVLTLRFYIFYKRTESPDFHRKLHSLGASGTIWTVVLIVVPAVTFLSYGGQSENTCFNFGSRMKESGVQAINYIISGVFITVPIVLCAIQVNILLSITKQYGANFSSQQEFWAQIKSLCFVLIMLVCFVPYHIFRLHYVANPNIESQNEIFLAITGLSCIDLLTFVGRGACFSCGRTFHL
ncbi:probable G-protein coupled receptor 141 [Alosa sapidissima]|uniref:probable G-protein coupled receptor 141 n=1 Tax=Alosa sapidissima TaxID=34773 RepID=UPI001C08FC16|nr:probable G-protein coupled receptor 141 [Alosa sapidissima]